MSETWQEGEHPNVDGENADYVNRITAVVREADREFQRVGGSSRHWVRDLFLPLLNRAGLRIEVSRVQPCSDCGGSGSLPDMQCCRACGGGGKVWLSVAQLLAALKGVVAVADRQTTEFDAARAAIRNTEASICRATNGIDLISAERQRQMDSEGWTPAHDDGHTNAELVCAAICYAEAGSGFNLELSPSKSQPVPFLWPWEASWWKPSDNPVRNLVRAGALIAAEIDRLRRAEHPQ